MSQPESNPFQAPVLASAESPTSKTKNASLDFISIAKKWERYRLIYNGVLVVATVGLSFLGLLVFGTSILIELTLIVVSGAIAVNFFFFLGPAFDGYCQWIFNSRSNTFGLIILVLGTLFSLALAAVAIVSSAVGVAIPQQL